MNKIKLIIFIFLVSFGNISSAGWFQTKEEAARAEAVKQDKKKTECLFKNKDIRKQPTPGCEPFAPDMKKRAEDLAKLKNDAIKLCKYQIEAYQCSAYQKGLSKEDAEVSKRIETCNDINWEYDRGLEDASSGKWDKAGFAANCAKNVGKNAVDGAASMASGVVSGFKKLGEAIYRQESIIPEHWLEGDKEKQANASVRNAEQTKQYNAEEAYKKDVGVRGQIMDKIGAMYNKSVDDLSIKLMCYTPRAREEFWCEYIGAGFVDAVGGDMAFKAAAKLAKMAGVAAKAKIAGQTAKTADKAAETAKVADKAAPAAATKAVAKPAAIVEKSVSVPNEAAMSFRSSERLAESSTDFGKGAASVSDDFGKGAASVSDDFGKGATNVADDIGKSTIHVADDIGKSTTHAADDIGKSTTRAADDVADAGSDTTRKTVAQADDAADAGNAAEKARREALDTKALDADKKYQAALKEKQIADAPARAAREEAENVASKQAADAKHAADEAGRAKDVAEFDKRVAGNTGKADDLADAGADAAKKSADDAAEAGRVATEKARKEALDTKALDADKKYQAALKEKQIADAPAVAAREEAAKAAAKQTEDAAAAGRVAEFDKRVADSATAGATAGAAAAGVQKVAGSLTDNAAKVITKTDSAAAKVVSQADEAAAARKTFTDAKVAEGMAGQRKIEAEVRDRAAAKTVSQTENTAARVVSQTDNTAAAATKANPAPKAASLSDNAANVGNKVDNVAVKQPGFDAKVAEGMSGQRKLQSEALERSSVASAPKTSAVSKAAPVSEKATVKMAARADEAPVSAMQRSPASTSAAKTETKITRDNPAYKFEAGDKVAVPRKDGTFSDGVITNKIDNGNGTKSLEVTFNTPQGPASKVVTSADLNKGYSKLYAQTDNAVAGAGRAESNVAKAEARAGRIERDNPAYKFEAGDKVAVPRKDGTFSDGVITNKINNADGTKSLEVTFNTPQRPASKVVTSADLNKGYSKLYAQTDDAVAGAARAETSVAKAEAKAGRIDRDNPAYKFEAGEKVAVPRKDGTFSDGVITNKIDNADGTKSLEVTFNTPQGPASKVVTSADLNKGYSKLYAQTDDAVAGAARAETSVAKAEAKAGRIDRDNPAYKFEAGEKVAVPRKDGTFSDGVITNKIDNADGTKSLEVTFNTPQGPASKVVSSADLNKGYSKLYAQTDDAIAGAARAESKVFKTDTAVAKAETTAAKDIAKKADSPAPRDRLPADPANDIHGANQKAGYENRAMSERARLQQADSLGVVDQNRAHALDYSVPKSTKDIDEVLKKVAPDAGVDSKELRRMLGYAPEGGYIPPSEFNQAKKFVQEIEKRGGQDYLQKLDLTTTERNTLNYLAERVPGYARYSDDTIKSSMKPLSHGDDVSAAQIMKKSADNEAAAAVRAKDPAVMKAEAEKAAQAKVARDADSLKKAEAEAQADKLQQARNRSAPANDIHGANQKAGYENRAMSERARLQQADSLGVVDQNRAHALDYSVPKSTKDIDDVLKKVAPDAGVDSKELRRMLGYAPEGGYIPPSEFNQAKKFVQEIEKRGGQDYLKKLDLTTTERNTFNYLAERVPGYARYSDDTIKSSMKPLSHGDDVSAAQIMKKSADNEAAAAAKAREPATVKAEAEKAAQAQAKKEADMLKKADAEAKAEKVQQARDRAEQRIQSMNSDSSRKLSEGQKANQAKELGITDDNRAAALEFKAPSTNKETDKIFKTVLGENSGIDPKELREMMSYSPASGYQTNNHVAQKIVEKIEKAGGVQNLNLKGLSRGEVQTLNNYLERLPEYARYNNPDIVTNIKPVALPPPAP